nr:MAG TPA: hypothetical protein [Caudoviricetes sp.]
MFTLAADIDNFIGTYLTSFSIFLSSFDNRYPTLVRSVSQAHFLIFNTFA